MSWCGALLRPGRRRYRHPARREPEHRHTDGIVPRRPIRYPVTRGGCSTPCSSSSAPRPTSCACWRRHPEPSRASSACIALAIAEGNACQYCVSAPTAIGRPAGRSEGEMRLNRRGSADDARNAAAVAQLPAAKAA
jgi:AhpD family alkylhydroperoxidase